MRWEMGYDYRCDCGSFEVSNYKLKVKPFSDYNFPITMFSHASINSGLVESWVYLGQGLVGK